MIKIKRIYETPSRDDGYRILVDRLWPRGLSKSKAGVDLWLKGVAPSTELRKWFDHRPERFKEFSVRYIDELCHGPTIKQLADAAATNDNVTLLYAARDPEVNHAAVLLKFLSGQ